MKSTTTTIRWLGCTAALALATLVAVGGSGAAASKAAICNAPAQACMTDAAYRALLIRSLALNRNHGLGE